MSELLPRVLTGLATIWIRSNDGEVSGVVSSEPPLQPNNKNEKSRATYDRNIFVIGKVLQVYISGASLDGLA
jgi:hypothetical protein